MPSSQLPVSSGAPGAVAGRGASSAATSLIDGGPSGSTAGGGAGVNGAVSATDGCLAGDRAVPECGRGLVELGAGTGEADRRLGYRRCGRRLCGRLRIRDLGGVAVTLAHHVGELHVTFANACS
jgi:hypothetical protein